MAVCKLLQNAGRCHIVIVTGGDGGGAFQHRLKAFQTGSLSCSAQKGVLYDSVVHTGLTQLVTQLRVVGHGDAFVVNYYTGAGILDPVRKSGNLLLFHFKNCCTWHKT